MKLLKLFIYLIIIVVILSGITAVAGYYYVTHSDQRVLLTKLVKKMTGYTLVLEGAVNVQLLPNLTLEAEKIAVKSFSGPRQHLFTAENLVAHITLESLSFSGLVLKTLTIDNPVAYIHQPFKGLPNWKSAYRRGKSPSFVFPVGQIENVQINNASFIYINEKEGKVHELSDMNLSVSGKNVAATTLHAQGVFDTKPFQVDASFDLTSLLKPGFSATLKSEENHVSFDGVLVSGYYNGQVSFETKNVQKIVRDFKQVSIFQQAEPLALNFSAYLKMEEGLSTFKNVSFSLGEAVLAQGNLAYDTTAKISKLSSYLTFSRINLNALGLCVPKKKLTATPEKASNAEKANQASPWSDAPLDMTWAEHLSMDTTFILADINCATKPFKSMDIQINSDGKILKLTQGNVRLTHGGDITVTGTVQLKKTPKINIDMVFNPLPVESFMKPTTQLKLPVTGTVHLEGKGSSTLALIKSLSGRIDLGVSTGQLPTSFFAGLASGIQKIFTGQNMQTTGELETFKAVYNIQKGVAKAEILELKTKDGVIHMTGSGKIDLARWAINHKFMPHINTSALGFKIPVLVRGSLNRPSVLPEIVNTQNLAIGVGTVVGGPVGAAIGALLGGSMNVAPHVSETETISGTEPKKAPLNLDFTKPDELFKNLFNR